MQGLMIVCIVLYALMMRGYGSVDASPVLLLQAVAYLAGAYYTGRCTTLNSDFWNNTWAWLGLLAISLNGIVWWTAS
jgi:hypothetical protein